MMEYVDEETKEEKAKRAMCSLIKIQTAHRFREMQIFWHI